MWLVHLLAGLLVDLNQIVQFLGMTFLSVWGLECCICFCSFLSER